VTRHFLVAHPDLTFISREKFPDGPTEGFLRVVPDLLVEVLSPGDSNRRILDKVGEYLSAGVRLVWVIDPSSRRAAVHRSLTSVRELREDDDLDGEEVVSGFRCTKCDEHEVALTRIDELHRLIARTVIRKRARLSPPEIRFLRKWLGHSGEDLAQIMGVTVEQISRWENGKRDIGAPTDRLLRLLVATSAPRDDYSHDELRHVREKSRKPQPLDVRVSRSGWRVGKAS
jgi:putative zinc finger/helix-turn-helix YgiT family protein